MFNIFVLYIMYDPYQDNPMWEDMQPGYLIPGHKYNLVINVIPIAPYDQTANSFIKKDATFIGHSMQSHIGGNDFHTLIFRYLNNNNLPRDITVVNTPLNKIYRVKTLGEYTEPGSAGWTVLNRYGLKDPYFRNEYMHEFGGKRKNNKKKTNKSKKAKSVRKKSKSLKKNRKTKKTKNTKKN